jgi:hypothetical protein
VGKKIIAAIGWSDEAEALGIVKPLYCTCCHFESPEKQTKGTSPELRRWSRRQNDEGRNTEVKRVQNQTATTDLKIAGAHYAVYPD